MGVSTRHIEALLPAAVTPVTDVAQYVGGAYYPMTKIEPEVVRIPKRWWRSWFPPRPALSPV